MIIRRVTSDFQSDADDGPGTKAGNGQGGGKAAA